LNQQREQLVDKIYAHALGLDDDERDAYLGETCTDDDMRGEVIALVNAAMTSPESFDSDLAAIRDRLWADVVSDKEPAGEDLDGERIDHWRIGKRLARGGLATVYIAHRDDGEFDQTVAFKVLRRGLDTDDVVARFRAERQILSALDHPAISKILDGGALPDGRPYLVLEYIDGEPITAWCARHKTGIEDRVRLIIDVLQALQHAHRHTVVHRDIKPSNILVSSEGNVALLDFGIAKLLDPSAVPGSSTLTRTGVSLLTPGYGSPEQHAGEAVTTASDIYQTGLVLYELLSGKRPDFAKDRTGPVAPSREVNDKSEQGQVRGDLDAIVQTAMHADPARRYGSPSEMIADLERYLDGRPVFAQPDTLGYRLRKLTKRRPWLLPAVTVLVLGVATYVVTLTTYSNQVLREQQRAEATQEFLVDLLGSANPFTPADSERGRNITVVEALEIGRGRLESELGDQPELKADLLDSIARVYASLDQTVDAIETGEQALALNRELYGEGSEPVLKTQRLLARRYDSAGNYDTAASYYAQQLDAARLLYPAGRPELGEAEVYAGHYMKRQGDTDEGVELLLSGIDRLRAQPDNFAETFIWAITAVVHDAGTSIVDREEGLLEEALAVAERVYGEGSVYAGSVRLVIGRDALYAGDKARSDENYARALEIYEQKLGPLHGDTIAAKQDYAVQLNVTGVHADAELVFRELSELLIEINGEQHRNVADVFQNLATTITYQGRYDESIPLHRRAYEIYKAELEGHYIIAFPLLSIASIEVERGNADSAYEVSSEALQRIESTLPDTYVEGVAMCLVGLSLEQQGDVARGSAMVEESHVLILKRDVLVPKYMKLCRVPEPVTSLHIDFRLAHNEHSSIALRHPETVRCLCKRIESQRARTKNYLRCASIDEKQQWRTT